MTELSLFKDDALHKLLSKMKLTKGGNFRYSILVPLILLLGWGLPAIVAACTEHFYVKEDYAQSFIHGLIIPVQVCAVVLLLIAEKPIDIRIRNAGIIFAKSGIVKSQEVYEKEALALRKHLTKITPDIVIIVLACLFTIFWVLCSYLNHVSTWFIDFRQNSAQITWVGYFVILWSVIWQYIWMRWLWKVYQWFNFMTQIAKAKIQIAIGHPDRSGGLAFLGEVQASFGIPIFAIFSVLSSVIFHRNAVEGQTALGWELSLSIVGFVILVPFLFFMPLYRFAWKLFLARQDILKHYYILTTKYHLSFENEHLKLKSSVDETPSIKQNKAVLSEIENNYKNALHMRISPIDFKSTIRLILATAGSLLPMFLSRLIT